VHTKQDKHKDRVTLRNKGGLVSSTFKIKGGQESYNSVDRASSGVNVLGGKGTTLQTGMCEKQKYLGTKKREGSHQLGRGRDRHLL